MTTTAKVPAGSKAAGRKLWRAVLDVYDLEEHELLLLREAVRTADLLDELALLVERDGLLIDSPAGPRVHPASVEARQARIALARILAALQLPAGEESADTNRRPQRRAGVRGVYSPRRMAS